MEHADLDAGPFGEWLAELRAVRRGERDAVVPCAGCTACCTSGQFVLVEPDEADALAHIPPELLFPAPMRPGHLLLGYDERGHCPMLVDGACSVYEHRPRACRAYDCRIFPAAGIEPDADKPAIVERARMWRFRYATDGERRAHEAVVTAGRALREEVNATARALRAIDSASGPDLTDSGGGDGG